MTRDELARIERELQFKLPRLYREFMLNFPADRVCGRSEGGRQVDAWEFTNRPARVIQLNRSVRRRGRLFDGEPWPVECFVIGSRYVHANYFTMGPRADGVVYEMKSDDKFYEVASSLEDFAAFVVSLRVNANGDVFAD